MITRIKNFCIHIYIGQLALVAVLSAGWWGILYPNFSMTEERLIFSSFFSFTV